MLAYKHGKENSRSDRSLIIIKSNLFLSDKLASFKWTSTLEYLRKKTLSNIDMNIADIPELALSVRTRHKVKRN